MDMDMDAQTWQANALVALDHIAEQRALSEPVNTAAIEDLLSVYDDVVFNFSLESSSSSSSSATAAVSSTSTGSRSAASGLRMSWYNLVVGDVTDAVHTLDLASPSASPLSATATTTTTTSSGNSAGFVAAGLRASFGGSSSNCSSPVDRNADADWERLDYDSDADEGQGLDIEAVRQWCMDRAGSGERQQQQSVFRFEYGRYASAEARRRLVVVG